MCPKRILFLLMTVGFVLSCSGCSLFRPDSELIVPPAASEENAAIKEAFLATCGDGAQLKSPVSGSYLSSFVVQDLDNDGQDEAVVFYVKDVFENHISIGFMNQKSGHWTVANGSETTGSTLYSVDFMDLNADGNLDILCYLEDNERHFLSVFSLDSQGAMGCALKEMPYSKLLLCDPDQDGMIEIVSASISAVTGPQVAIRRFTNNGIQRLHWRKLDKNITSFESIIRMSDSVFLIDAFRSDNLMVTDVVVWDALNTALSVPLLDKNGESNQTKRFQVIPCRDINGDDIPEIPCQSPLQNSEIWRNGVKSNGSFYQTDWCAFQNGQLEVVRSTLFDSESGWGFTIPKDWESRFTICAYPTDYKWNFYESNRQGAQQYLGSVMFDREDNGYTWLKSEGEHSVYAYGLNETSGLQMSEELLRQAFQIIGN